jgi:hypothetical protein
MVIWKYVMGIASLSSFDIPEGARFLSLQVQGGLPCLWFLVDSEGRKKHRTFTVRTTGERFPDDFVLGKYFGTFQIGGFVGHVFEI